MAAWLPQPVMFDSSRAFDCDGFTPDQCAYYKEHWHNWYVADLAFALPTVAFFMCTIGIFVLGYVFTKILDLCGSRGPSIWQRLLAATRYLSYRGFHIHSIGWNSAPVGLLLLAAIGTIYFFTMDLAPQPYYWPGTDEVWGNSPPLGTRSGWLALACMPFLFATASKANWISLVTGVTHEKLQVFHRWIAYAFFILALMHTFPFIVWHIRNHDMVSQFNVTNIFEYWTGVVALLFQAWLTGMSWGPFRNLGYEFFKAAHFLSAIIFMIIFFWHCSGTLTSWHYFVATAAVYVPCWIYPWLRTVFEYGLGQTAQLHIEENNFICITIPANFDWHPGQHCFLRFRGLGLHAFTSHPFTICSVPSISPELPSEITFYVRLRGGLTSKLFALATQRPGIRLPVWVDGPYGGIDTQKLFDSDRLLVISGGSGAGWMLPFVETFLQSRKASSIGEVPSDKEPDYEEHTILTPASNQSLRRPQSLHLILATRDVSSRTWFYKIVDELCTKYGISEKYKDLKVQVHLTGEAGAIIQPPNATSNILKDSESQSSAETSLGKIPGRDQQLASKRQSEAELRGRPDLPRLIREEVVAAEEALQNVGVFVCGPLEMQNDVRNVVAKENLAILTKSRPGGVYLHLEHFSWA